MPSERQRCCVCHRDFPVEEVEHIGQRVFCRPHYERALQATEVSWARSGLLEIGLTAAFVAVVAGAAGDRFPAGFGFSLLMALIPAGIWLLYVYRQDRVEPEPIPLVLGVGLLGAIVTHTFFGPLVSALEFESTISFGGVPGFLARLGQATLLQLLVYGSVRYSVFFTDEFDEPVDGMIYAVAASLGAGSVLNLQLVLEHRSLLPLAGTAVITSTTLLHVASGTMLGYGLGRRRFDPVGGERWMALSFAGASLFYAGAGELIELAGNWRGGFDPLIAFALSLSFAAAVVSAGHFVTARFSRRSLEDGHAFG